MSGEIEPIKQTDNGVIPGLNTGNHGNYLKQKKPSLGIFTKGQYDRSGLNGGLAGLTGSMPLGKNSNLSAYVGAGNIFQVGAEYSYTGQIANKLSFVGSAGLEGTVSFTGEAQHDFSFSDNTSKSHCVDHALIESHVDHLPFDGQIIYEGQEVSHPDEISAETKHQITLNTQMNSQSSANSSISLPNNQIKGVLKGELRYGNEKFYVGAGVKVSAETKFVPKTDYKSGDIEISTNDESTVEYDNHYIDIAGHYDENWPAEYHHHAWTYQHKKIKFDENVELNNIDFNNDEQISTVTLQKPKVSVSPIITLGGRVDEFAGALEVDLQGARVVGSYNLNRPFTTKTGPNRFYRQLSNHNQAEMNLSLSGQSEDDINSVTVNIDGQAPINDRGTSISAGIGAGNAISGQIGLNQDFQIGDNFTANVGLGAKGTISLKDTDKYVSDYSDTATTSDLVPISYDSELIQGEHDINIHIYNNCTYNNNASSTISNGITVPRHNIYTFGTAGLTYTNDKKNFSVSADVTGGFRGKLEPDTEGQYNLSMQHEATYEKDPYFIFSSGTDLDWVDPENPTELTSATSVQGYMTHINDNVQVERNFNTQTKFNTSWQPYAGIGIGTEYKFPDSNWSAGGQVGTSWNLGPEIKNNGINFKLTAKCRIR